MSEFDDFSWAVSWASAVLKVWKSPAALTAVVSTVFAAPTRSTVCGAAARRLSTSWDALATIWCICWPLPANAVESSVITTSRSWGSTLCTTASRSTSRVATGSGVCARDSGITSPSAR